MCEVDRNINGKIKDIAVKLRRIRELKGLTREKFCEPLGENSEYWGLIERGEQPISLVKLLQVCEVYEIPLESVVTLDYTGDARAEDRYLRQHIMSLLNQCQGRQLEVVHKFIEEIALSL